MTWFKEAVERRTVNPSHLTRAPIQMRVEGALFSSTTLLAETKMESWKSQRRKMVDAGARWDVYQAAEEWDRVLLQFHLSIADADVFRELPCHFGVHALCKKTRWRKAVVCDFHPDGATLSLVIPRDEVAGEVILAPSILHAGEGEGNTRVSMKGKRLAGGFAVSVLVDPPGEKFGTGLELRWFPFPEDQRDSLFYLDMDSESPLLLINKRHAALKHIFEDRSKSGARFRLRNSLFSFIAVDVWLQLAMFAGEISRLELDDDQDSRVLLSRKIVRSLAKMLKMREDEIVNATVESVDRARLHRLLQHHFKLAGHQDALVSGFGEEAAE